MNVKKRDNKIENFDINKIKNAIKKTFNASNTLYTDGDLDIISQRAFELFEKEIIDQPVCIEKIQDSVVLTLMRMGYEYEAMAYTTYRSKHESLRLIKSRAEFIEKYSFNGENAATSSEIDANANIQNKNVATLEAEIYKDLSTQVSRYRVVKKLKELYGDEAPDYVSDLQSHVIYKHDESAPAIKPYCMAVSLYPFINKGTATIDKLNTSAPKNLTSFAGQFNNLIFLLSSQVQGAVAAVEFFNIMSYYCVKEWGKGFYMYDSKIVEQKFDGNKSISDVIEQTFQNIVYTLNQPAGNRSYQSPFTNISYFDSNYWHAMFGEFAFPDGTKLDWGAVDYLQQKFIRWFNAERKKCLLTFPVETMALLSDGTDVIDKEYKALTAEMYAEGHSFFTYLSDNADSLSSCCRLKNVLDKPEFNFTNGLTDRKSVV